MMTDNKAATPQGTLSGMVPNMAKCKSCGKSFDRAYKDWGHMIGKHFFCTYRCMRAYERKGKKASA